MDHPLDFSRIRSETTVVDSLPTNSCSIDAIQRMGFTRECATEIFRRYATGKDRDESPDTLLNYAYRRIRSLRKLSRRGVPAREAMTQVGISQSTQDLLLDPWWSYPFKACQLHFCVHEYIRLNYYVLIQLLWQLKRRANPTLERTWRKWGGLLVVLVVGR